MHHSRKMASAKNEWLATCYAAIGYEFCQSEVSNEVTISAARTRLRAARIKIARLMARAEDLEEAISEAEGANDGSVECARARAAR